MINDIFNNFFESELSLTSKDNCAILEEKSNTKDSQLKKIKIDCNHIDFKMIKSDKITINKLFKGQGNGQKKHCDYLMMTNDTVYFIELQTSIDEDKENDINYIIQQFKGTVCITDYIDSVLFHFYGKNKFFQNSQKRFVLFCKNTPIPITSAKSRKEIRYGINDKPDKFKIIQVENDGVIALEEMG